MFHKVMNKNPANNSVKRLNIEGILCEEPTAIKIHVLSYYKELYREKENDTPFFSNLPLKTLSGDSRKMLEKGFTEDEVFTVIKSLAGDKVSGPDGFPLEVYKRSWPFMKKEIMVAVNVFLGKGLPGLCLNATFVTLIDKKDGGKCFEDF